MSESVNVSDEFMEFYGREAEAIAEVQKAEALVGNIPFEIGTQGTVIVKSVEFAKAKDKEVDDPNVKGNKLEKKGHPTVKFTFVVIDHPQYSGVEFPKTWYIWENASKSRVQVYKDFLDELETRMSPGIREIRDNPNCTPAMIGEHFTKGDPLVTINFRVVEDAKNTFDGGKRMYFDIPKEIIPADSNVVPPGTVKEKQTITSADVGVIDAATLQGNTAKTFKVGEKLNYLDMEWAVEAVMGDKVVLAAPGVESKFVKISALG